MFEVTVEDSFAAGHYLRNYKGKCENPHGHNYKIRVTLAGNELDKAGLLVDFKDLRDVMKHVIERLDHRMINDLEPFTVLNPSAENLAKYFYDETNGRLRSTTSGRVWVKTVTVFETDTTTATYSE
jgi:6-pyruvoyltetrahydropterin/6-carboxytetrahydropterin synthase